MVRASKQGALPEQLRIREAIVLTNNQIVRVSEILTALWRREYLCPAILDLRPTHGFESRILKDGYSLARYVEWLVLGCSDAAEVAAEQSGRPHLLVRDVCDEGSQKYDIVVPLRSDYRGVVHVDGVIPRGLSPRRKKTAPSAVPKTV